MWIVCGSIIGILALAFYWSLCRSAGLADERRLKAAKQEFSPEVFEQIRARMEG